MDTATASGQPVQMVVELNDSSAVKQIKASLKLIPGVKSIKVKKTKNAVEMALEEAHNSDVTKWDSVEEYFKAMYKK